MFRFLILAISEVSAIAFALYLGVFLFQSPEYAPQVETAMRSAFVFCGICAAYLAIQSGSLALAGVSSTLGMALDILTSLIPLLVVGFAIFDSWRGGLSLSDFKQYGAYFALGIVLMDVIFNAMIMARLSRRYLRVA